MSFLLLDNQGSRCTQLAFSTESNGYVEHALLPPMGHISDIFHPSNRSEVGRWCSNTEPGSAGCVPGELSEVSDVHDGNSRT